jgi:uncharacterized protein YceK
MVRRTPAGWVLLSTALLCAGCGTIHNLTPNRQTSEGEIPARVYGGVQGEWGELQAMRFDDVHCMNLIFLPLYLIDLPLSAIGDTLTLPWTIPAEVNRSINNYYFPKQQAKSEAVGTQAPQP